MKEQVNEFKKRYEKYSFYLVQMMKNTGNKYINVPRWMRDWISLIIYIAPIGNCSTYNIPWCFRIKLSSTGKQR